MEEIIYACKEHVEMALDDIVNDEEKAPVITKIQQEEKCGYCSEPAEYEVKA